MQHHGAGAAHGTGCAARAFFGLRTAVAKVLDRLRRSARAGDDDAWYRAEVAAAGCRTAMNHSGFVGTMSSPYYSDDTAIDMMGSPRRSPSRMSMSASSASTIPLGQRSNKKRKHRSITGQCPWSRNRLLEEDSYSSDALCSPPCRGCGRLPTGAGRAMAAPDGDLPPGGRLDWSRASRSARHLCRTWTITGEPPARRRSSARRRSGLLSRRAPPGTWHMCRRRLSAWAHEGGGNLRTADVSFLHDQKLRHRSASRRKCTVTF